MQHESRRPQSDPNPARPASEPILLPAAPSYPLLGPPKANLGPERPITELVTTMTEVLKRTAPVEHGERLRAFADQLNQRQQRGERSIYTYPTESLERLQRQLAYQGRSAANLDEGQIWRHLARAFAMAMQQRD